MFIIELGSTVISHISGFKGIVTSRAEHINGCDRYWVAPKVNKAGEMPEGAWIDDGELDVTKKPTGKLKKEGRVIKDPGGFPSKIK